MSDEEKLKRDIQNMMGGMRQQPFGVPQQSGDPDDDDPGEDETDVEDDSEVEAEADSESVEPDAEETEDIILDEMKTRLVGCANVSVVHQVARDFGFLDKLGTIRLNALHRKIESAIENAIQSVKDGEYDE